MSNDGRQKCCRPSEVEEGGVAEFPELLIVLRVDTAHGLDHFFAELHGRRQWLRIASQNVAKVDVEQFARFGQHQVVQVAVAHAQQVSDNAIAG